MNQLLQRILETPLGLLGFGIGLGLIWGYRNLAKRRYNNQEAGLTIDAGTLYERVEALHNRIDEINKELTNVKAVSASGDLVPPGPIFDASSNVGPRHG